MTFDDGILTVYSVGNAAEPGKKPVMALVEKESYYYSYGRIGVTRYYQAKQADQEIDAVVHIPGWNDVKTTDVIRLQEKPNENYQVDFVQPDIDENGLRIMKLTLRRVDQHYEMPGQS